MTDVAARDAMSRKFWFETHGTVLRESEGTTVVDNRVVKVKTVEIDSGDAEYEHYCFVKSLRAHLWEAASEYWKAEEAARTRDHQIEVAKHTVALLDLL